MEVILLERIERLGQMGDIVKVKPGYARNYLLPQAKALRSSKENLALFESRKVQLEAANLKRKQEAEQVAEKMNGLKVVIIRQAAETGQLSGFGGLTDDDDFQAVHLFGDLFGFLFAFQVGGFQLNLAGFKQSQIFFAGTQSFSLRQQIVAGITRFHFDDIAHLSQTFDTFE